VTAPKNTDPIDVLFIDAEKEGYDAYLKECSARPPGWPDHRPQHGGHANPRYIEAITTNPDLDTSFVLMEARGSA